MDKKIFGGIAVLAIAAVAAWNVSLGTKSTNLSEFLLANVEALAQEGDTEPGQSSTWQVGSKTESSQDGNKTTSVTYKCCRPQSDLLSCSYENC